MAFLQHLFFLPLLYGMSCAVDALDTVPLLGLPLDCMVGENCFIQNYVDMDDSTHYRDYHCGFLSYDGHKGTDFRLNSMDALASGVSVFASAEGIVRAIRDGMEDTNVRTFGKSALQGREAGNSIVIVHGNGWETQYAHLRKGSVAVRPGQAVSRGMMLGQVGISGNSEFLHLHFEIRHEGKAVDPFVGLRVSDACSVGKQALWQAEVLAKIPYIATGIVTAGFMDHPPVSDEELTGAATLPANSPALVFGLTLFGAQADDSQVVDFYAPDGTLLAHKTTRIDRNMAQYRSFIGKKRQQALWPSGKYRVVYQLLRKQNPVLLKEFSLQVL